MMTAAEARTLGGIARQARALLAGIDKLPEAFEEVEQLESRVATAKQAKLTVEADVAAVRAAFNKLDQDYQGLQKQYGQLDQEYRIKKQTLDATLSTTLADLAAAQHLKQETGDQLHAIKSKIA